MYRELLSLRYLMSHRHNLCHTAMPRLCSDRYSYSKKRNVYQLDGVLLNFCTRRTGQSVVTPVPTGTRAACSTGDLNTNFDTEQVSSDPRRYCAAVYGNVVLL